MKLLNIHTIPQKSRYSRSLKVKAKKNRLCRDWNHKRWLNYELEAIATYVIGETGLMGGSIVGALIDSLIMASLLSKHTCSFIPTSSQKESALKHTIPDKREIICTVLRRPHDI
ncbi:MAG: hypothetical protein ACI8ZB_000018 [Desulforhopalus sp.]|jgi:hypothetical protein